MMCLMLDAVTQNTPGYSEGYPAGVPRSFSWQKGTYRTLNSGPPADFTAVTGWGAIYPDLSASPKSKPDATIQVANAKTYVHLKSANRWVLVQQQSDNPIEGGHFLTAFTGNKAIPMSITAQPDGSVVLGRPPAGYNDHFWPASRGTFAAGAVDGVYVQMDMKTDSPEAELVASIGADWWRSAAAAYVDGFKNNPGAGMSNWIRLSMQWSTLYFYSMDTSRLALEPPPPLAVAAREEPSPTTDCRPHRWRDQDYDSFARRGWKALAASISRLRRQGEAPTTTK